MKQVHYVVLALILSACGYEGKTSIAHVNAAVPGGAVSKNDMRDSTVDTQAPKLSANDCIDPDLSRVERGMKLTMCDGTIGLGTFDVPVPKEPKKCRNAISAQGNPVLTYTINTTTNVNAAIDEISITGGHALSTGMPIQFSAVADNFALKPNRTYFAIVVTGTRFKVAATFLDSLSSTQIDLVANSIAGSIIITAAPATGTVDDFYSSALSPALWNDEYNCNEKNFEEVSNSASWLIPSSEGTWGAWTNIWHDRLSGLYFTNIQPSTSPFTFNWQTGMSICTNGLNSGDGFGKWRMPTQKELMQLYINGIGNVVNSAGNNLAPWSSTTDTTFVWSSTLNSGAAATVWGINLGNGKVYYLYRTDKTMYLMCVRDAQ